MLYSDEAGLRQLVETNLPQNRNRWALEWKSTGGKVLGLLGPSVPEELVAAAGVLPWRISGVWDGDTGRAIGYRPPDTCLFCNHVLEALLRGDLDFLDGVVATNWNDDIKRLWDLWVFLRPGQFHYILPLPHSDEETDRRYLTEHLSRFLAALEEFAGRRVGYANLQRAIAQSNRSRWLLRACYQGRKKEIPSLRGAECLGLATAAQVMPREEYNRRMEALLPYLSERRAFPSRPAPRLLASSDLLDNPAYLELIEDLGCAVAMDDLDTGSRYCWWDVDVSETDPLLALARHYISCRGGGRSTLWERNAAQLQQWAAEFRVDAIVELPQLYEFTRQFRTPWLALQMEKAGIPFLSLVREYRPAGQGQLRTRLQAFLEMVTAEIR